MNRDHPNRLLLLRRRVTLFAVALCLSSVLAGAQERPEVEVVTEELQRILETHELSDVITAFGDLGITFPGSLGFRGMQYTEYRLERNCWEQGPQAGLLRNDNCITYQSTCSLSNGGSKVTVDKPGGDTRSTTYAANRRVYVCESTIHLPPEEEPVLAP